MRHSKMTNSCWQNMSIHESIQLGKIEVHYKLPSNTKESIQTETELQEKMYRTRN